METTTYISGNIIFFLSQTNLSTPMLMIITFLGASPPKRSLSARNPPSATQFESDSAYVAPEESVVNEFMEDIRGKKYINDL